MRLYKGDDTEVVKFGVQISILYHFLLQNHIRPWFENQKYFRFNSLQNRPILDFFVKVI